MFTNYSNGNCRARGSRYIYSNERFRNEHSIDTRIGGLQSISRCSDGLYAESSNGNTYRSTDGGVNWHKVY